MSNFVDPRRPNNVPGNFCFLVFLSAEGFEDCETVIDGISNQLRGPDSECSPPHEVGVILDCGSDQSIP